MKFAALVLMGILAFPVFAVQSAVVNPSGGEVYSVGQTQTFKYVGRNFKTLMVDLSRDGGVTWEAIGTMETKDRKTRNQFVWVVSGASTNNARIRISGTFGKNRKGSISVLSNSFIITAANGLVGTKGDKGDVGPAGPEGARGESGSIGGIGPEGAMGPQGLKGEKGNTGATGPQGPAGKDGKDCKCNHGNHDHCNDGHGHDDEHNPNCNDD